MPYSVNRAALPEVLILQPRVFEDDRGFFFESFNAREFELATGVKRTFVQDNQSRSVGGVLRGLHYQIEQAQGKLVRVIFGEIFDVVVDIRSGSKNFGKWIGVTLSDENKNQLWIPEGFAHGFFVRSDSAEVFYKTTDYWNAKYERTILWNDSSIGIKWPIGAAQPKLSSKDECGALLKDAEVFP